MWSSSHAEFAPRVKGQPLTSEAALSSSRAGKFGNSPKVETYHRAELDISIEQLPDGSDNVLSCRDCLARHSEYMDGRMDAESAEQWRAHLAVCSDCARYDRVLRRGLQVLHKQPAIEVGSDFLLQLQQRLAHEDRTSAWRPMTSLASAAVAVAAMLAFAAWVPVLMLARPDSNSAIASELSPVATEIAWHGESAVEEPQRAHIHLAARRVAWSPGPANDVMEPKYTPVVLEAPTAPPSYHAKYSTEE